MAPASSAAAACARVSIPLSAITMRSRGALATSSSCARAVDREGAEVARVDADDRRVERDRTRELVCVVRFDERVEPERIGAVHQRAGGAVVEVAQDEQRGVGAGVARLAQVIGRREEPLREQRHVGGRACGA